MTDFKGLRDRARHLLAEHSGTVKQGITKAGGFVGGKVGHNKVDPIEQKLQDLVDKAAGEDGKSPPPAPTIPPPAV